MLTRLSTLVNDRSTCVIRAEFTNEDGEAVVPDSLAWSLRDGSGNVVNERDGVIVEDLAASIDIVLSGDDLDFDADGPVRFFTIAATYSSHLGSNLPLTGEAKFKISNFVGI